MKKLLKYFDTLKFSYKANFLIFIIAGGMISIIVLSQISIFILKDDFDTLFDKRTKSLIKLQTIKDSYKINIQDTLNEFEKNSLSYEQTIEVLNIAKEIIEKNWSEYKYRLNKDYNNSILSKIKTYFINSNHYKNQYIKELNIENIDNKMVDIFSSIEKLDKKNSKEYFTNINFNIDSIFVYLGSLVNYDLNLAINEKRDTDNIFKLVTIFSFISIFFVVFFTIILSLFITFHFRKLYYLQEKIVEKKTKELKELNNNLEQKIKLEVAKNRKKDIIMFQQARFASLGEMLNNIAHQWRQPLGSITMIIQSFQTKMRVNKLSPEFVEQKVKDALLLAQNMSNTLDDFKNFFSPNRSKNSFFIKDCVEHSIELSKYFLNKENIKIDLIVKKDKKITTFYNELSHIFLNIISNSKDALVSSVNKNDRIIKIIVNSKKNFVFINIIDNGGGVPDDILPKIFEPYYTTKYKSAGTGIGLYMSKQIIEKHLNGEISCKNIKLEVNKKVFKGASFTITIPIFEDKNE
ncbi:sensor histidine kinase [Aliarcobacter skirrowii]|uniref:histidine kinase n=1 Tax=Aliarcobacter skirrowii CCUG 10374 TaxID=1032239 RepID=A0AAD0WNC8_9BACT|nr:HAMP domain-containing sensor histidine kinase [Aliarcobacter skirrowii]AXX84778.1 two-component system sensor histidine kinase [Aliarcobacter skirrowii CCUG 10374]KAB0620358.1 HAMP domain-containing histidine kinase [Aliarcobacter skirrowii CCUG 10374]RXI25549.1 sensor histidine kinase [Aliarcobacter skirrowii CCUG 10374]SUV14952.1 Sensor protein fixL [Aliarcobacter skirrowii]